MAYPALVLCLIFSAWMLFREVRRRPSLSKALWIPTLFVMVLGSRPISQWLSGAPHTGMADSSLFDEVFFAFVFAASLVIATMRGVKWGRFLAANLPVILLYVFFALSVSWSGDPVASAKRIVKDFALLSVIAVVLSEREPSEAVRAIFIRSACLWFPLSIVFNHYFPRFARQFSPAGEMMLSGVTVQKNTLGEMVLIFCAILLWDYQETRATSSQRAFLSSEVRDQLLLFLMGIFLLVQSRSKTALISLVICLVFTVSRGWLGSRSIRNLAFFLVFSTPYLLFFTKEFGDMIQPIVAALGRDMTFTGRTNIWSHITPDTVNPVFGSGYWNFWGSPAGLAISDSIQWAIPNAHCGYLDIYLDGGICGLFVLFFVLFSYGRRMLKHRQLSRFQAIRLGILAAAIIYNLTESSFVRMGLLWFTTLLMMVDFPKMKRGVKAVQRARLDNEHAEHNYAAPASAKSILAR